MLSDAGTPARLGVLFEVSLLIFLLSEGCPLCTQALFSPERSVPLGAEDRALPRAARWGSGPQGQGVVPGPEAGAPILDRLGRTPAG